MKQNKKRQKGTSLLEMLIAVLIYSFAILAVLSLFEYGTKNWHSIEEKNRIQTDIRKSFMLLNTDLKSSTTGQFEGSWFTGVKVFTNDYRHGICFQSAVIDNKYTVINKYNKPVCQKYILYYIIRPPDDQFVGWGHDACLKMPAPQNPDDICPHKWLIKKEFNNLTSETEIRDSRNTDLATSGNCTKAQILSKYILSFNINDQQAKGYIEITLKAVRLFEFQSVIYNAITNNQMNSLQKETIQIDDKIFPGN